MKPRTFMTNVVLVVSLGSSSLVYAQGAGAGADFNKADRRDVKIQTIKDNDKPVKPDPVGNALVGGAVSGLVKGSVGAAAAGVATGTATGTAVQGAKDATK